MRNEFNEKEIHFSFHSLLAKHLYQIRSIAHCVSPYLALWWKWNAYRNNIKTSTHTQINCTSIFMEKNNKCFKIEEAERATGQKMDAPIIIFSFGIGFIVWEKSIYGLLYNRIISWLYSLLCCYSRITNFLCAQTVDRRDRRNERAQRRSGRNGTQHNKKSKGVIKSIVFQVFMCQVYTDIIFFPIFFLSSFICWSYSIHRALYAVRCILI